MIKFSIIIPIYNVEKYLPKCLDSVINQTYHNYEVILVCDDSQDKSNIIADDYALKYHFKKIFAKNTGLSIARNIGVQNSQGEYLIFLDSDDYLQNDYLETISLNLKDKPDLIRIQVQDIFPDKIVKHKEKPFSLTNGIRAFDYLIKYHYVENAWCYCYNAHFYKKNNFKFMDNCIAEDYGLIPLVIAKAQKVLALDYIGYNYVQRENSLMTSNDYKHKLKKMDDMLKQAEFLKLNLENINNINFISFINNSLIYYSTTLKYQDYKRYLKILRNNNCFNHFHSSSLKGKIRDYLLKINPYLFYHYIVRF